MVTKYKHPIPGRYEVCTTLGGHGDNTMQHITILFPHTTPLHAVYKVHTLQYSNSYMYNEHTVMYIMKLQDHNRSEYSTSNVSGLDSHKEIR